jgi:uncharacterized protein (TIGR00369 family)
VSEGPAELRVSREVLRQAVEEMIPFNRYLGLVLTAITPGFARVELPFRPELIGDPFRPALHGGVLSALIDACAGAALWTRVEPADKISTIDLRVDYLRPGEPELIICEAHVIRLGGRIGVVDARVFHPGAPERTIATGKGVYNVRRFKKA